MKLFLSCCQKFTLCLVIQAAPVTGPQLKSLSVSRELNSDSVVPFFHDSL